ncbi:hypothetical protein [Streptomyces virginiae]|uniref:hypothetical protein n=1 Tax=Streptomyces virginiae TaxID=1961 RepID=UPI002F917E8F
MNDPLATGTGTGTDTDDLLDVLLLTHAEELRSTVARSLHTEAGLEQLSPLRAAEDEARLSNIDVVQEIATEFGMQPAGESPAVRELVDIMGKELAAISKVTGELWRLKALELTRYSLKHLEASVHALLDYERFLRSIRREFRYGVRMDRQRVLQPLNGYTAQLSALTDVLWRNATSTTGAQAQLWASIACSIGERTGVGESLCARIEWIFDRSDEFQEVTS